MKKKLITILALVTMVFAFVIQSSPVINAAQESIGVSTSTNTDSTKAEPVKKVISDSNTVETKTVKEKAAEDKTAGTTPHTGVMGYMYAKQELKLDITNKKAVQSSPIAAIANKANSVLDTSEWQGNFTDAQVKSLKSQHKFIILRVQYGSNYRDKTFAHNLALVKKYGLKYGVYSFSQYINPSDAAQEARDLYNRAPDASFYVNDYEDQTVTSGGTDASTAAWLTEMKKHSGNKKVLFYSYASFMKSYAPNAMKKYDAFWLAAYQTNDPTTASHALWQYTSTYKSSALGQNVDASIATSKSLDWFLGVGNQQVMQTKNIVIKNKGYNLWNDLDFKKVRNTSDKLVGKLLKIKCYWNHTNGSVYYSVYDGNTWLGYINKDAVKDVVTVSYPNKMVSINNRNQNLWNNLAYTSVMNKSSKYYDNNSNLEVRAYYKISAGYEYYSLYDANGKWQGYINTTYVSDLVANNYNQKVVTTKSYPLWRNFFWKQIGTTKVGQTYTAKYIYNTGNGRSYLSLYDTKGNWAGYINKDATGKPNQQVMQTKNIVVTSKIYNVWNDLNFAKIKTTSNKLFNKSGLQIKCYWNHTNGSTYDSLYDGKTWLGYINVKGVASQTMQTKNITIKSKGYNLWNDLGFEKVRNTSDKYVGKNLQIKCYWNHGNGSVYYSVYDGNSWIGYINSNATK